MKKKMDDLKKLVEGDNKKKSKSGYGMRRGIKIRLGRGRRRGR